MLSVAVGAAFAGVLGVVNENVSGQPLGQYLDAQLWKPLGMADTGFLVPADKLKRYAKG